MNQELFVKQSDWTYAGALREQVELEQTIMLLSYWLWFLIYKAVQILHKSPFSAIQILFTLDLYLGNLVGR